MLGLRPLTTGAIAAGAPAAGFDAGPVDVLLSDIGWTGATDDSAWPNRIFEPRVLEPLNLERSIPVTPAGARRAVATIGDMVLNNADGGIDHLLRGAVDGRRISVYRGKPDADFSEFDLLFRGIGTAWRDADDGRAVLGLRGAAWQLDVPLVRPVYAGTGGLEGGADIRGKFKPAAFGHVRDVSPVLVDALLGIYQVHFRQVRSIDAVCDGGAEYTSEGDVADITATTVSPGCFKTQLDQGLIRVGTMPTKTITVTCHGDAPDAVYVETAADIVFRLLHDLQGFDDGRFRYSTFTALNRDAPGPVNLYIGLESVTTAEAVDQVMAGICGWWTDNPKGQIEVGLTALPLERPRATLFFDDLFEFALLPLPEEIDPPYWRVTVGYARNWTPMDVTQIVTSIVEGDADRLAFLTQEWRFTDPKEDPLVKARHFRAQELIVLSAYDELDDAEELRDRLFEMYSTQRRLARLRTKKQGQKLPLGATIAVDYPRFGLSGGRNVVVVGHGLMASSFDTTLTVMW